MTTPEELFWNDPHTVSTFAGLEVPPYWREFFLGFTKPKEISVLDVGCGGGRITDFLLRAGFSVCAVDAHAAMIEATRRRLESLYGIQFLEERIVQAPMTQLPFLDAAFDVVVANGTYHNAASVEEFEKALEETSRVLRPKGSLCLNIFYAGVIDHDIRKGGASQMFLTAENLPMILLPEDILLAVLKKYGLTPSHALVRYESSVITGKRSVLRGVFKKTG